MKRNHELEEITNKLTKGQRITEEERELFNNNKEKYKKDIDRLRLCTHDIHKSTFRKMEMVKAVIMQIILKIIVAPAVLLSLIFVIAVQAIWFPVYFIYVKYHVEPVANKLRPLKEELGIQGLFQIPTIKEYYVTTLDSMSMMCKMMLLID